MRQNLIRPWGVLAVGLLGLCLFLRVLYLQSQPGISGDEAMVGAMMYDLLEGKEVNWNTPTKKKISPLYIGMGLPFFWAMGPTVTTLRLPAVFWGIVLVFLTYWLMKSYFRPPLVLGLTLLVACFPMHLVYSRLYIEQSLMGMTTLITLYFALRGNLIGTLLAHLVGLFLHPVNVFITPMVVTTYGYYLFYESTIDTKKKKLLIQCALGAAVLGVIAIVFYVPHAVNLRAITYHLSNPGVLLRFVYLFFGIMSGVTVIEDFAGPLPLPLSALANTLTGIALLLGMGLGFRALRAQDDKRSMAMVLGWLFSLFSFYVVGGLLGVDPGKQRYSMFVSLPTFLCVLLLWQGYFKQKRVDRLFSASVLASLFYLGLFSVGFIHEFEKTGGRSHEIYKTASVAPKVAAYEWIQSKQQGQPARILAQGFWLYHPLNYLAHEQKQLQVKQFEPSVASITRAFSGGKVDYLVAWADPRLHTAILQVAGPSTLKAHTITDESQKPLIRIYKVHPQKG